MRLQAALPSKHDSGDRQQKETDADDDQNRLPTPSMARQQESGADGHQCHVEQQSVDEDHTEHTPALASFLDPHECSADQKRTHAAVVERAEPGVEAT
jgi:hypothetical protein